MGGLNNGLLLRTDSALEVEELLSLSVSLLVLRL